MKSLYKRIIAGAISLVTLFFSCTPSAYALGISDTDISIDVIDFIQWVHGELKDTRDTVWGYLWSKIDDDVCPSAPSLGGRHNFVERRTQVDGKVSLYYICEYCGKSAGEVAQQAYNDYVGTLPATGYNSFGGLSWKIIPTTFSSTNSASLLERVEFISSSESFYVSYPDFGGMGYLCPALESPLLAPLNGIYSISAITIRSFVFDEEDGFDLSFSSTSSLFISPAHLFENGIIISADSLELGYIIFRNKHYGSPYLEGYYLLTCIPDTALSGDIYNVTTRPTGITGGNYGIVGDDGQLTVVNGDIINETNNTYYNPATGQSGTINNWSYDYSDRSYNLTLDSGNTVTVRYGDENITIIEGDVTYIIYYIMDGSGSGSGDMCEHEWYQTGHREGNCLTSEQRTYTCSKCGKQYTETDPAPGHSWHIIQEVSTKYDESGNLIQEGYIIYECERCKEQYKATNDTGPPPSGGGDSDTVDNGGLLEWINGLIKYLSDHLSGAVDLILSFFREIPGMFGGFLDFLSAMFPFLPDDVVFLFTFGIAAVVFIGIIKALRR